MIVTIRRAITHAYIIDHYNSSVRIIDLVSHTTDVVCVDFIQFKFDSEPPNFENLAILFTLKSFCQKSAE